MRATVCVAAAAFAMLSCTAPLTSNTTPPSPNPASPTPQASPLPSPIVTPSPSPTPVPTPPPTLNVAIVQSDYGRLTVQTDPGASCSARVYLPNGHQVGGLSNPQIADGNGTVAWTYPQTPTDPGTGTHVVDCLSGHLGGKAEWPFQVGA